MDHRARADQLDQAAADSFDRCDTDGFLSQWGMQVAATRHRLQAAIDDNGGTWEFLALFDLDGNWVPGARQIPTRFGSCWKVPGESRLMGVCPVRRSTIARYGFVEGWAVWPARAQVLSSGSSANVWVDAVKTVDDNVPPTEVLTADRWDPSWSLPTGDMYFQVID